MRDKEYGTGCQHNCIGNTGKLLVLHFLYSCLRNLNTLIISQFDGSGIQNQRTSVCQHQTVSQYAQLLLIFLRLFQISNPV